MSPSGDRSDRHVAAPGPRAGRRRPGGPPPADTSPAWFSLSSLPLETPGTEPVPLCVPRGAYAFPRRPHPVAAACWSRDTFSGVCGASLRWRPSAQASLAPLTPRSRLRRPGNLRDLRWSRAFLSRGGPRSQGLVKRLCLTAVSLEGVVPPVSSGRAVWTAVSAQAPWPFPPPEKASLLADGFLAQECFESQGCVQREPWGDSAGAPGRETPQENA